MSADQHENLEERLLHRLLFFTDAVFAIVLTLLVLELRPPGEGSEGGLGPRLFAFALSFAIIGVFWLAHMATTRRLARFDWPTSVANLVFLFPICLIPFVSAWVGRTGLGSVGWIAYSLVLIATSVANMLLVLVQSREGGRLLAGGITARERAYRLGRSASPGLAFLVGLIGASAGYPLGAAFCWALIPVFMLLVRLAFGSKPGAA